MGVFSKVSQQSESYVKILLYGSAGAGKTFSSLVFAKTISKHTGAKCALIDTEGTTNRIYASHPSLEGFTWDDVSVQNPSVGRYIELINEAIKEGYKVLVIDSISPEWEDVNQSQAQISQKGVNTFQAWGQAKQPHKQFVNTIISSPIHIIATGRAKTEYVFNNNKPQAVGIGIVQSPDVTYNFHFVLQLSRQGVIDIVEKQIGNVFYDGMHITESALQPFVNKFILKTETIHDDPLRKKYIQRIGQLADQLGIELDENKLNEMELKELEELGKNLAKQVNNAELSPK